MENNEKPRRKLSRTLPVVCLVLIVLSVIAGGAYAKYRKTVVMNDNIVVGNRLVEAFTLVEHEAVLQDGAYQLTDETTVSDSLLYIPGAVIPMDPTLTIVGKTEIPALLYVEVIDQNPAGLLHYQLTEDWTLLPDVKGYHNGAVYVYQNGRALTDSDDLNEIHLLRDDAVTLGEDAASAVEPLQFCGYLLQSDGSSTPDALFTAQFSR